MCGTSKMFPRCFYDVGKPLALRPRFGHEFKDQKLTKSQSGEAIKISGEASWLSLLSRRV
jgi:hypothetical protein